MGLTNKEKKYILHELLRTVEFFSSKKLQEKKWIGGEGPDLDEMVCIFFDIAHGVLKDYAQFGINDAQYKALQRFYEKLQPFPTGYLFSEEVWKAPGWDELMQLAKEVLVAFNYKRKSRLRVWLERMKYKIISFFILCLQKIKQRLLALFNACSK